MDILLTREQVKIMNDTGSLKIKMSKLVLKKYSIRETSGGFLPFLISLFAGLSVAGALTGGGAFRRQIIRLEHFSSGENCQRKEGSTPGSKIIGKT